MLETMVVVQGGSLWLPLTYIFYNIIFFYVGIWTLQDKQNIFPVAAVSSLMSETLVDVVFLCVLVTHFFSVYFRCGYKWTE